MTARGCWGIFRERAHSPGREFDDTEILRLTAKHLEAKGFPVSLWGPEEVGGMPEGPPRLIFFFMCERLGLLRRLRRWENDGVLQVNAPSAVLNTYRERMIARIVRAGISFPASRVVSTAAGDPSVAGPVWIKRSDVHNTQEGDVVFAPPDAEPLDALRNLAARGIPRAVIQAHVPGDLLKFYGVGDPGRCPGRPPWFRWFYHRGQRLAGTRFDPRRLVALAQRAAAVLGLEVYGGDAIVNPEGTVVLIDVNAWPSFALYRDEASAQIASYLAARLAGAEVRA